METPGQDKQHRDRPDRSPPRPDPAESETVALLHKVIESLSCTGELDEVLDRSLAPILRLVGSDWGWVILELSPMRRRLAAGQQLPREIRQNCQDAVAGSCRCIELLHSDPADSAPSVVTCELMSRVTSGAQRFYEHFSVPVRAAGRNLGCLNLSPPEGGLFAEGELRLLSAVADLIGLAIDRARMNELEHEQRLHEVARAISGTLDLPSVLISVVRLGSELVGSQGGALALVSTDRRQITYPYLFNLPPGLQLHPTPRGKGVAWYCVETGRSLILDDYRNHPSALPRWLEAGVHGFISVPVVAGDERIGALGFFSLDASRRFSQRDLALAESIGRQAGIAIQNARRFEATRRHRDELVVLHAVARAGTVERSEDALIDRAVREVTAILYPERFGVFLLDEKTGGLRLHPASGGRQEDWSRHGIPGSSLQELVVSDGQPRRLPDAAGTGAVTAEAAEYCELCVPLKVGDRAIGVISATRAESRAFDDADLRLLTTFAGQLATAIDRLRTEAALSNSESRFRMLAENARDVIYKYCLTPNRGFEYISPSLTTTMGYTPAEFYADPDLVFRLIHSEDRRHLEGTTAIDPDSPVTLRWIHGDGSVVWMEHRNVPVRDSAGELVAVEGIARDITERKQLEEQLRLSQKMEAIGQLAGGVAHDFNNLLTVILNYSAQQIRSLDARHPLRKAAEEIQKAGERAASLTRQLLAFSRKQVIELKVLDLNTVLTQLESMLRSLVGESVEIVIRKSEQIGWIRADPGQIEQVIVNLLLNSRDSMSAGGRVTITTAVVSLTQPLIGQRSDIGPGQYVRMTVSDTGCGMDKQTLSRLFEPFFTTKERGRGTGLGLSTVYGIVRQSGGAINVRSDLGKGTTVEIHFPFAEKAAEIAETPPPPPTVSRAVETILVVEDEPALRPVVREILEISGYQVLEAGSGEEAINLSSRYAGSIHLMLTDVVMPGMSGRELAERISAARPDMKVLYTSGHTDDAVIRHGVMEEGMHFLQKPFDLEGLARKVREVLDSPRA
ncbi:MAG: GAF domain-containing protein [Acidobacteriota bacterium]